MEWKKVKTKKQKGSPFPKKLADFFEEEIQDGDRDQQQGNQDDSAYHTPLSQRNRFAPLYTPHRRANPADLQEDSEEDNPRDRSPLKPMRPQPPAEQQENREIQVGQLSQPSPQTPPANKPPDPLINFPITDQPMTQQFFKEFMISFRCVMQDNMAEIRVDMKELVGHVSQFAKKTDQRVTKLENRISEMTGAHNELIDAHRELMDEVKWMKEKLADAEDRNRRNNVKIRGVSETVSNNDLKGYVRDLLKTTLPTISENELVIDRAHRLPKPGFIADHLPRDVITRIHFYHVKELLLASTRGGKKLPDPFRDLTLYQDLSQATLQARKEYSQIAATLRYKKIPYKWGFPPKMIINDQGVTHVIRSVKEGKDLLAKWNIPVFISGDPKKDRPIRSTPLSKQQPMDCSQDKTEDEKSAVASAGT
ncbi:unnamed protein product [Protopolystoma xenopodis]|uniref:Uncharacterized protein n=1 Tax=Protopolystoma xenopodis TaxID=117903 RepID=A0A448WCA7_9PLAT|nr:unnamed protein product [Protopolystoma xenopodis]